MSLLLQLFSGHASMPVVPPVTASPAAVSAGYGLAGATAQLQRHRITVSPSPVAMSAQSVVVLARLQGAPMTAQPSPVVMMAELGLALGRLVLPIDPTRYTHRAAMETRFSELSLIQLTDRMGTGQIDDAVLERAIVDAGILIDGKLMSRYAVPFTSVPALIEQLASDIAFYRLHTNPPKEVAGRYDNALRLLDAMASGSISLGFEQPPAALDVQFANGRERVFGRGMGGF